MIINNHQSKSLMIVVRKELHVLLRHAATVRTVRKLGSSMSFRSSSCKTWAASSAWRLANAHGMDME